jgi:hypothetical protein
MAESTVSLGSSAAGSTYFDAQSMANTNESLRDASLGSFAVSSVPPTLPEDAPLAAAEPPNLMVRRPARPAAVRGWQEHTQSP